MAKLRKPVTVRLSEADLATVEAAAAALGMNRHEYMVAKVLDGSGAALNARVGDVELQTRRDIGALMTSHPMGEAMGAIAFNLAQKLDEDAGLATAGIAKQLASILTELSKYEVGGDDDDDLDLSAPSMGDAEDNE